MSYLPNYDANQFTGPFWDTVWDSVTELLRYNYGVVPLGSISSHQGIQVPPPLTFGEAMDTTGGASHSMHSGVYSGQVGYSLAGENSIKPSSTAGLWTDVPHLKTSFDTRNGLTDYMPVSPGLDMVYGKPMKKDISWNGRNYNLPILPMPRSPTPDICMKDSDSTESKENDSPSKRTFLPRRAKHPRDQQTKFFSSASYSPRKSPSKMTSLPLSKTAASAPKLRSFNPPVADLPLYPRKVPESAVHSHVDCPPSLSSQSYVEQPLAPNVLPSVSTISKPTSYPMNPRSPCVTAGPLTTKGPSRPFALVPARFDLPPYKTSSSHYSSSLPATTLAKPQNHPTTSSPSDELDASDMANVAIYDSHGHHLSGPWSSDIECSTGWKRPRATPVIILDQCSACVSREEDEDAHTLVPPNEKMYIRPCEWEDKPCGMWVGATQARVKAHFEVHHGVVSSIKSKADEQRQKCRWKGCECGKPMLSRNLVRHIINVAHFGMKYKCSKCPTEAVRLDDFMEHKMRCPDAEPVLATNAPRVPKKPVFANKRMRTI